MRPLERVFYWARGRRRRWDLHQTNQTPRRLVDISWYTKYTKGTRGGVPRVAARTGFLPAEGEATSVGSPPNQTNIMQSGRYKSVYKIYERNKRQRTARAR